MDNQQQLTLCFNCGRDENAIPMIAWQYQNRSLWVCCECMPNLIHKWPKVVAQLQDQGDQT